MRFIKKRTNEFLDFDPRKGYQYNSYPHGGSNSSHPIYTDWNEVLKLLESNGISELSVVKDPDYDSNDYGIVAVRIDGSRYDSAVVIKDSSSDNFKLCLVNLKDNVVKTIDLSPSLEKSFEMYDEILDRRTLSI